MLNDSNVQFRSMWHEEAPHAKDGTNSIATKACPSEDDQMVVFHADVWSPGSDGLRWDMGYAGQWLIDAQQDGLSRSAIMVGTHGASADGTSTTDYLETLIDITAYPYANLTSKDWKATGSLC